MTVVLVLAALALALIGLWRIRELTERVRRLERRLQEASPPRESLSATTHPPDPPAASVPPPDRPRRRSGAEWEALIGGQWLNHVGALALIVATGFFLKYAADHRLLTEPLRVLLTMALGALLLVGADRARRADMPLFARGLVGAGTSALYLAIYAAFNRYHLVPQSLAMTGMVAVTAVTFWQALRHDSQTVAILGWAGGFLTPVLLADGSPDQVGLFGYVAFLVVGLLAILFQRPTWKWLEPLTFAGTYGTFWLWYQADYTPAVLGPTLAFLTLFWGLFFGLDLLRLRYRPHDLGRIRHAVAANNAAFFATGLYVLLDEVWHGPGALALAGLYGLTFAAIHRRKPEANDILARYALTAIALAAVGTFLQADGRAISALWSLEALALVWAGLRWRWPYVWQAALGLFSLAAAGVLGTEADLFDSPTRNLLPILNARTLTLVILAGSLGLSAVLFERRPPEKMPTIPAPLQVGWCLAVMLLIALEASDAARYAGLTGSLRRLSENLLTGSLWGFYGTGLTWLGRRIRQVIIKRCGIGIMFVAVVWVAIGGYDYLPPESLLSVRALRMAAVSAVAACALHVRRQLLGDDSPERAWLSMADWLLVAATLAGWVLVCGETFNHFETRHVALLRGGASQEALRAVAGQQAAALSVAWLLYAVAATAVGFWRRLLVLRWLAIGLLALGIVKVFVLDLASLAPLPRILSLLGLGVVLMTASFLYQRYGRLIDGAGTSRQG